MGGGRRIKSIARFVLLVFGIPLFGYAAGFTLTWADEQSYVQAVMASPEAVGAQTWPETIEPLAEGCPDPAFHAKWNSFCVAYPAFVVLRDSCFWTCAAALAAMAAVWLTGRLGRQSPGLLAALFGIEIRLVCILLSGLILVQGVILTIVAAGVEALAFKTVNGHLIAAVGFGSLFAALVMIRNAFRIAARFHSRALAAAVTRQAQPRLWQFIDAIAAKLQASPPKNLIVGLEPELYATAADIYLPLSGTKLSGETMHLSLSLMRLLSHAELAAAIGHELGHFKGRDTAYSLRFLPIYRGIGASLRSTHTERDFIARTALFPAREVLSFCLAQFEKAELSVARSREFAADAAGAQASSAAALIAALAKSAVFAPLWWAQIEACGEGGDRENNMAEAFEREARRLCAEQDPNILVAQITESNQPHPTDRHPTFKARAQALQASGLSAYSLLDLNSTMSSSFIDRAEALEVELSAALQNALGPAAEPASTAEDASSA